MKILFTVHSYYPNKDGVQMVTQAIAEQLVSIGHEVTVITSILPGTTPKEIINGVNINKVDLYTRYGVYWGNKKKYISIIQELCKKSDVLITVCTQNAFTDLLLPHLHKFPCKKILYMHGMHDFRWKNFQIHSIRAFVNKLWKDIKWGYLYWSARKYFSQYTATIQLHPLDYGYKFFKKHFGLEGVILENIVDSNFWIKKSIYNKNSYFVCVSNYSIDKNQKFLLEAFYKSDASKTHELILVGSDATSYYQQLLEYNTALQNIYGPRKVSFRYQVSRQETIQLIQNASLYLFSSLHEVYPLAIMEAMASGVPFISTDVGCLRALPGGMFAHSPEDMAHMIDLLMQNEFLAINLGELGYYYAKHHFQLGLQLQKLQKILNNI